MTAVELKIGIIGCGGISRAHLGGYSQCEGVKIVAAADSVAEKANEMAGKTGAIPYTDYIEMLDRGDLDGVSIATPPRLHRSIVIAALERGIHVLCEKPLAMDADEAKDVVEAAEKAGKILMTAFCHRFHEPVMVAREMIQSGKLGVPVMFRNRFGGKRDFSGTWFSEKETAGGGSLMDTSIHSIDLFRYLMGEVEEVFATLHTFDKRIEVEDCNILTLKTVDGVLGTIEASWATPFSTNVIEIYCSEGAFIVDYMVPYWLHRTSGDSDWIKSEFTKPERFVLQAQHFIECIREGKTPLVTGVDGLKANEIADAAYRSAKTGRAGQVWWKAQNGDDGRISRY